MPVEEINVDTLVGTTHHHGGLSYGNLASMEHKHAVANPKAAALESLGKMKLLADLGCKQVVLPPQKRPDIAGLRALGYTGSDKDILERVYHDAPDILAAYCSSSAMWTANAATISPSSDTADGRVHITPANLVSKHHRSLETIHTARILRSIFNDERFFVHHHPLHSSLALADEGAANHCRFASKHGSPGVELFVYGCNAFKTKCRPQQYPTRQTLQASQAVARLHQLQPQHVVFAQQNPDAIDAGVFHNDVISVNNEAVFLFHELAFVDTPRIIAQLRSTLAATCQADLVAIEISQEQLSLQDAVASYLFNAQIVTTSEGSMTLIAPKECQHLACLKDILADKTNPINDLRYVELKHSMRNGGGPACLRLRIVLTAEEQQSLNPHIFLNDILYNDLTAWIEKHYRDRLTLKDLTDPLLLTETYNALDELTAILHIEQ